MITKSGHQPLARHAVGVQPQRSTSRRVTTRSPDKSVTSPRLNRNQFGANIGGPVGIPKLYNGKDKTFFFFNWESGYAAQGASPGFTGSCPPAAMRTGDFSGLVECADARADRAAIRSMAAVPGQHHSRSPR